MAKGISAFRAPLSFGLAGVMQAEARVYYEVLFDLAGVGRVSDLFSARLKRALSDELEFRAALLFGVIDSFRSIAPGSPIRVECGIDSEKVGITISFTLPAEKNIPVSGLKERVTSGKTGQRTELMLHEVLGFGDHVLFRAQPSTGLAEVCVLALRKSERVADRDNGSVRKLGAFEALVLPEVLEESPEISEYVALGDINYQKLFKNYRKASENEFSPSGEVLLEESQESALEQELARKKASQRRRC